MMDKDTRELQGKAQMPEELSRHEFSGVVKLCRQHLDNLSRLGTHDSDTPHYIYEAAMTAVFGADVWVWINAQ